MAAAKHDVALVQKIVVSLLLKPEEDLHTLCSLSAPGMDSLVTTEVRQWCERTSEFDISVLEMMDIDTIEALVKHAAKELLKLFHGGQ
ncbi:Acyl transferase/acyl hydrolase/lysophospholipase [Penicillium canescens]|uniref:Acyl transferase/acyl hydrolase/lysophospholipase n=1 Tax=Penicillium canescens TaxID=5083 RepID=A0AAD6IIP7_PENCN|nr:Acyl transferase/acyl hydrolase/lysophospholipase [Penicillium canescens]KAJ6004402.1 Acyl transferase/acyl hydrolase/lysophospholipase [Penicillium canescens]KAJ6029321.1 Acyl transferase/acyl hydrolase/lysophospholipase [Penicillium canescens]KAJ6047752.1 Acyl transferase/acyl hydrolase/lysophospholipase [Penicillium canescens]KAJ6048648.1 Acyl transferase/acyl hydrolase/lysophospholipase [Penicillium canescens]KAJ6100837.1 Acyl transferase/acyl hydrolase/lysophospholipase [Penicillium ca